MSSRLRENQSVGADELLEIAGTLPTSVEPELLKELAIDATSLDWDKAAGVMLTAETRRITFAIRVARQGGKPPDPPRNLRSLAKTLRHGHCVLPRGRSDPVYRGVHGKNCRGTRYVVHSSRTENSRAGSRQARHADRSNFTLGKSIRRLKGRHSTQSRRRTPQSKPVSASARKSDGRIASSRTNPQGTAIAEYKVAHA